MSLNTADILGLRIEDGIEVIKKCRDMDIITVETFSPKRNDRVAKEARILRVLEKDKNIELTVGYF